MLNLLEIEGDHSENPTSSTANYPGVRPCVHSCGRFGHHCVYLHNSAKSNIGVRCIARRNARPVGVFNFSQAKGTT